MTNRLLYTGHRFRSGLGEATSFKWVALARAYTGSMKVRVILEFDSEAQAWSAVCPELPGCASFGRDEAEARSGIEEAIHLSLTPDELDLRADAKMIEVTVG